MRRTPNAWLGGLILALAISYKVTPALFVPYLLYKRSWRTVGAPCLGMGIFLLVVPSLVIGPTFNGECLAMWWKRMMSPFLVKDFIRKSYDHIVAPGIEDRRTVIAALFQRPQHVPARDNPNQLLIFIDNQ